MGAQDSLPDIYSFNNFRAYLQACQEKRSVWDKAFTKSGISKLLGLPNTRSFFSEVIAGRRSVTTAFIERFVVLLALDNEKSQYFRTLVRFNQAENAGDRELYLDQLIALNKTPKKILTADMYRYFKEWHHNVVRAMLDIYDVSDDFAAIAAKVVPRISAKQAQESVSLLEGLNLIARNRKGFYKPTEKAITTPEYMQDELILQYQMRCLQVARDSIALPSSLPKHVSTNIFSISREGYKRLQRQIDAFRSQVRSLVHKDEAPAEMIYQICLTALPVIKGED